MKFLKYLLFIVLALIILFFLMGLIKPTVKYGHEITVNKPVKEAWAVQQDPARLGEWLKGFKSIDLIEGEKGVVGSKYKVVVNPQEGQPDFEMTETITSLKEFDHMSLSFDSDMMVFDQTTTFTPKGNETVIRTDSEVKGKGIVMKSMFAMMEVFGGSFKKQEVENVEALKKVIDNNTTNYYPEPVMPTVIGSEIVEPN